MDIPIELLKDDKNICENISDKGCWGTGNIRIKIFNDDNYYYILDLIKQSLNNEKESSN